MYGKSMFNFVKNFQIVFQSISTILHPISNEWGLLLLHILIRFLNFNYLNVSVVVSHGCLNFQFHHGKWCQVSFHMLLAICVSSLVKAFFHLFLNWVVYFLLLLSFKRSLYILDISPLSAMCFATILVSGHYLFIVFIYYFIFIF